MKLLYRVGKLLYRVGKLLYRVGKLLYRVRKLLYRVGKLLYRVGKILEKYSQNYWSSLSHHSHAIVVHLSAIGSEIEIYLLGSILSKILDGPPPLKM